MLLSDEANFVRMNIDVLVFAAHPDDAELNIGGTIASLVKQGKRVGIIDLTQGEMGTRGNIQTRKEEAKSASRILGIDYRSNLNLGDSLLYNSRENQIKIVQEVRKLTPSICITGAQHDRHPDHGKATKLVLDAIFYSGLAKIETLNEDGSGQQSWRPSHILHYMHDQPFVPDFIVNISSYWETKKKAIQAYKTQFNVEKPGKEAETYISTPVFFKQLEARARYFGHLGGFDFGEPFQYYNGPMGVKDFDFLL